MAEMIGYVLSFLSAIICSYLAYKSNQEYKANERDRKRTEKQAEERRKESLLSLQLMHANCSLTVGTALAVKRGKANGELEQGLKDVEIAMKAYQEFHEKIAVEHLSK